MSRVNKIKNITPPPSGFVKNNGFTIIEVALALAIAGLIFLVVFLVLPALQNSQKDTERRQAVGQMVSALMSLESDHQGEFGGLFGSPLLRYANLPSWITFLHNHRAQAPLPSDTQLVGAYNAVCGTNTSSSATSSDLFVTNNNANGESVVVSRSGAFAIKLSNGSYYCKDVE